MVERRSGEERSYLADVLDGSIAPEMYGTGRVCRADGCGVRLSRYNSTDWCGIHESPAAGQRPWEASNRQRRGGRRRRSSGRRASAARGVAKQPTGRDDADQHVA